MYNSFYIPQSKTGIQLPYGTIINDNFPGGVLNAQNWKNPGGQTILSDGNNIRITGSGSSKNVTKAIKYTGWGASTLRNYSDFFNFKINSLTNGIILGSESLDNFSLPDFVFSGYAVIDFDGGTLEMLFPDLVGTFSGVSASASLSGITLNTTDIYTLKFDINNQRATVIFTNNRTSETVSCYYDYISLTPNSPNRPNIFYPAMGVWGSCDITIKYFRVTTTEQFNPDIVSIVDSIGTGYCATAFTLGVFDLLKQHTSKRIQIMGGGGNNIYHATLNLSEILRVKPKIILDFMGANSYGDINDYIRFRDTIIAAGIDYYKCAVVNGGDPNTAATLNYNFKTTFGVKFVDLWSGINGFNEFASRGLYVDSVHPNDAGHEVAVLKFIEQLPLFFPH